VIIEDPGIPWTSDGSECVHVGFSPGPILWMPWLVANLSAASEFKRHGRRWRNFERMPKLIGVIAVPCAAWIIVPRIFPVGNVELIMRGVHISNDERLSKDTVARNFLFLPS
jgi:hypothetical protein